MSFPEKSRSLYSFFLAFGLAIIFMPGYIRLLKEKQVGQFIREEGPPSHVGKAKTPTTGGVGFIVAIVLAYALSSLIAGAADVKITVVLLLALSCGLIGLVDDMSKVANRANKGISAPLRLILEALLGGSFGLILLIVMPDCQNIFCPILTRQWHMPGWLLVFLSTFLVTATTNAINLHDGMDGLAAGTTAMVLASMAFMLASVGNLGMAGLAISATGALLAFLVFNRYPAKIFMGDTGSLFLGGLLAGLTLAGGLVFWFIPLSVLYIAETLSVILQVTYFKLTKPFDPPNPMSKTALIWLKFTKKLPGEGKRLFKMAPLHHHFEAVLAQKNVQEWQVVLRFWLVQLAICILVLATFLIV